MLTCPSYSCVEDAVCDVVFIGIGDHDLYGVILEALRLMDRHGVGHLEWHGGIQGVVVLIAGFVLLDGEAYSRLTQVFEIITNDI